MCCRATTSARIDRRARGIRRALLAPLLLLLLTGCDPALVLVTDPITDVLYPDLHERLAEAAGGRVRRIETDPFSSESALSVPEAAPVVMSMIASGLFPDDASMRDSRPVVTIGGYAVEPRDGLLLFDPGPAAADAAAHAVTRAAGRGDLHAVCFFVMETDAVARRIRSEFVNEFTRASAGTTVELREQRWFSDPGNEAVRRAVRDARDDNCVMVLVLGTRLPVALEIVESRPVPVIVASDHVHHPRTDLAGWFVRPVADAVSEWLLRPQDGVLFPARFHYSTESR